uniref:Cysteine rich repeat-containing domain protein n=1 Tax=Parastrongyloides trichosuri TaxID=131310 RepID=A0A0N4ZQC9_PARTI
MEVKRILGLFLLLISVTVYGSNNETTELEGKEQYNHIEEMKDFKVRRKRNCCATCPQGRDCGCGDCSSFGNLQCRSECMPACEKFCIQAYEVQTVYEIQQPRCHDQCMPKCESMCINRINIGISQPKCHDLCMPTCAPACVSRLVVEIPQPRCHEFCMPACQPSCTQQIMISVPQKKCQEPCMPSCLPSCTQQEIIITQPAPIHNCGIPQCPTCEQSCVSKYNVQVSIPQKQCPEACFPSCHNKCVEAVTMLEIQIPQQKQCPEACLPSCNRRCIEAVTKFEIQIPQSSCGIPECPRCEQSCIEKYKPQPSCHYACKPLCTPQCIQYVQSIEVKSSCGIRECPTCEESCVERHRPQVIIPVQQQTCVSYCQPQCAPQCVQAYAQMERKNIVGSQRRLPCNTNPCICDVGYIQCSPTDCCLMYFNMAKKYVRKARKQSQLEDTNSNEVYQQQQKNIKTYSKSMRDNFKVNKSINQKNVSNRNTKEITDKKVDIISSNKNLISISSPMKSLNQKQKIEN